MPLKRVVVGGAATSKVGPFSVIITPIHLKNVRGFRCLNTDFGTAGASTLISGDNGDGKTTVPKELVRKTAMPLKRNRAGGAELN